MPYYSVQPANTDNHVFINMVIWNNCFPATSQVPVKTNGKNYIQPIILPDGITKYYLNKVHLSTYADGDIDSHKNGIPAEILFNHSSTRLAIDFVNENGGSIGNFQNYHKIDNTYNNIYSVDNTNKKLYIDIKILADDDYKHLFTDAIVKAVINITDFDQYIENPSIQNRIEYLHKFNISDPRIVNSSQTLLSGQIITNCHLRPYIPDNVDSFTIDFN